MSEDPKISNRPVPSSGEHRLDGPPTAAGSTKIKPKKSQFSSVHLKRQLQAKSSKRRSDNAAETRVDGAASRSRRNDLQPSLRTLLRPVGALKPSPRRTRVTTPGQLERVINSVRTYGIVLPLLITGNDEIISGHILWEACKRLGLEEIECRVIDHLQPSEIDALTLALNRLGETGAWDDDLLRERVIEIQSAGIELTSTGFTLPEIDQIIIAPSQPPEGGDDDPEDTENEDEVTVTQLGDLFQLGDHRLLCGDALAEASYQTALAGNLAQCVFSDPPYNCPIDGFVSGLGQHRHEDFAMAVGEMSDTDFTAFLATYLGLCRTNSSLGAMIFACMDFRQIEKLLAAGEHVGLTRNNVAVWNKGAGGMTGSVYRSAHEFIAVFCNGKTPATNNVALGAHGRDRTNVWSYPGANRRGSSAAKALADHPTPKPVGLVEDALLDVTVRGDLVLDPFMGSGTTLIAAESCGRIACGIELDPRYVDRTIRRWEHLSGDQAIHLESGMAFQALRERRARELDAGEL